MASTTVHVDMNKKCAECGKGGAVQSGICLKCTLKAFEGVHSSKPMKSAVGRAVQKRIRDSRK